MTKEQGAITRAIEALKLMSKLEWEWNRFVNSLDPDATMDHATQTKLHGLRHDNHQALKALQELKERVPDGVVMNDVETDVEVMKRLPDNPISKRYGEHAICAKLLSDAVKG